MKKTTALIATVTARGSTAADIAAIAREFKKIAPAIADINTASHCELASTGTA